MKLIVGLGNPGPDYAGTRHNVGFAAIDLLAERHGIPVRRRDFRALFGDGQIAGEKVFLVKPMTYMNLSGEAVAALARMYKIEPVDIWVIVDDIALPTGKVRLRLKGSPGGHNGLDSIQKHLKTEEYPRLRIGVGAAKTGKMVGHVLGRFRKDEQPLIEEALARTADAIETGIREGFENAMNRFN